MQLNSIPIAHIFEFLGDELWFIVYDNCFGNAEPCNDIGLDEFDHCSSFDLDEGFSFVSFGVILGCCQDEEFVLWSFSSYFR